jgi:para-aminobenzoate synthetase component 1
VKKGTWKASNIPLMGETFTLQDIKIFKNRMLNYLQKQPVFCILDANDYYFDKSHSDKPNYHSYDYVAAVGVHKILKCNAGNAFERFEVFKAENPDSWIFGYFGYDLKNELEDLISNHDDVLGFDEMYFFVPETLILVNGNQITIETRTETDPCIILESIQKGDTLSAFNHNFDIIFKSRITKENYLLTVANLRNHIIEGDVYEVSFCQEFYAENAEMNPFDVFMKLSEVSPQPFSAFMKMDDKYILCASMERYLRKEGNKLISQPIKGTIRRGRNAEEDEILKNTLLHDEKERAENVMIVDLVRNDLSRTCIPGTVKVEELFGIYEFPGVFQMISTVVGEMQPGKTGLDAIRNSFPMGSMTGAPKIMAMQIIEQYEKSKRGIYSGALGYFAPNGDFDFNVVIRTLLYNASKKYLSLHVGSAITYDSDPEKEYEECLVKIAGILKAI